ncbi:hypothetical protein N8987_02655 [Crocinitomix sp.]|nr:hypothetical protein [Crocinitomix sp.]MDA7803463.1 hypothetical protein [Crocinitomix sp.]
MEDLSKEENNFIERSLNSTLKLYNEAFIYAVPLILLISGYIIFFDFNWERLTKLLIFLWAFIFFKIERKNSIISNYQVAWHQFFIVLMVLTSILAFVNSPSMGKMVFMLIVGANSCYLMIKWRTTIIYYLVYHSLLLLIAFESELLDLNFVIYSLIYSSAAFVINNWLNGLINSGKKTEISEKKYHALFEHGNSAILLVKPVKNKFAIIDGNARSESVFGFTRGELLSHYFHELSTETLEKKADFTKGILNLKSHEIID